MGWAGRGERGTWDSGFRTIFWMMDLDSAPRVRTKSPRVTLQSVCRVKIHRLSCSTFLISSCKARAMGQSEGWGQAFFLFSLVCAAAVQEFRAFGLGVCTDVQCNLPQCLCVLDRGDPCMFLLGPNGPWSNGKEI